MNTRIFFFSSSRRMCWSGDDRGAGQGPLGTLRHPTGLHGSQWLGSEAVHASFERTETRQPCGNQVHLCAGTSHSAGALSPEWLFLLPLWPVPPACAPCLCPLPQGSRKKCTGHVPHTLRTTLPSLFRRGSGVPSLAQTSKEAVSHGGVGAAQPEHTMHSRCAGLSTSIPSQLLLWQCLVGVISTPPPAPFHSRRAHGSEHSYVRPLSGLLRAKPLTLSSWPSTHNLNHEAIFILPLCHWGC